MKETTDQPKSKSYLIILLSSSFFIFSAFINSPDGGKRKDLSTFIPRPLMFNTITVTSLGDNTDSDGLVTLREAILAAETDASVDGSAAGSGPDVITFDPVLVMSGDKNIILSMFDTGLDADETGPTAFQIATDVTLVGPSGGNGITLFAAGSRIFDVLPGATLSLENLTLKNGLAKGGDGGRGQGGGGGGAAGLGGAIFSRGMLSINHCTFTENQAIGGQGGQGQSTGGSIGEGGGGGGLGENGGIGGENTNQIPDGGDPNGGQQGGNPGGFGGGGGGATGSGIGGTGGFGGGAGGGFYRSCSTTNCSTTAGAGGDGGFGGGGGGGGGVSALGVPTAGNGGSGGFGGGGGQGGNPTDNVGCNAVAGVAGPGGAEGGAGAAGVVPPVSGGDCRGPGTSGHGGGGAGLGGAIFIGAGTAQIANSTFCGNSAIGGDDGSDQYTSIGGGGGAGLGGAIFNRNGSLVITGCTISDNIVAGGVSGDGSVSANQGGAKAGGIYNLGDAATASLTLNNSIVANSIGGSDMAGNTINAGVSSFSGSNNIIESLTGVSGLTSTISSNPVLGALSDNGGPTFTKAITIGSPALDAGNNGAVMGSTDQRGGVFTRIYDGDDNSSSIIDIGAYEKVLVDYGDAPDMAAGSGQVTVFQEEGINDGRISDMGDDAEMTAAIRDDYGASNAAIAYNATNNEYLVVWRGDDDTNPMVDNEFEIFGQRINAATGAEIGGDFRISDMGDDGATTFFAGGPPSVAWNSTNNEYLVVWYGDDNNAPLVDDELEIFGQRLSNTGSQLGTNDFRISDAATDGLTSYGAQLPDVAYNATNNEYLVVWQADDDNAPLVNGETEIFGQRLNAATGAEVGANDFRISDMGDDNETAPEERTEQDAIQPAIAWDSDNNQYLVVWQGNDDAIMSMNRFEVEIWGQRLSGNGTEIGTNDFRISTMGSDGNTSFFANDPDVVYNSENDQFLVVWEGVDIFSGDFDVYGQKISSSGTLSGSEIQISTLKIANINFDYTNPAVVWNSMDNEYSIAFQGDLPATDNETEIFIQRLDDLGALLDESIRISDMGPDANTLFRADNPAVAYGTTNNKVMVVWEGDDDSAPLVDNEKEIFTQQLNSSVITNFATSGNNNGPVHLLDHQIFIGSLIDAEDLAQASTNADGDDIMASDDEDGISDPGTAFKSKSGGGVEVTVNVTNNSGSSATLYGWIDFDLDGLFENDGTENTSVTVPNGSSGLDVTLNFTGNAGDPSFARFRLSTDAGAAFSTGAANDGEVEDYQILTYESDECPDTLHVDNAAIGMVSSPAILSAAKLITSDATLPGSSNFTYRSGVEVQLQANFTVPAGTIFLTLKEDCSVVPPVAPADALKSAKELQKKEGKN